MKKKLFLSMLLSCTVPAVECLAGDPGIASLKQKIEANHKSIVETRNTLSSRCRLMDAASGLVAGCTTLAAVDHLLKISKPTKSLATVARKSSFGNWLGNIQSFFNNSTNARFGLALGTGVVVGALLYKLMSTTKSFGLYNVIKKNNSTLQNLKTELHALKKQLDDAEKTGGKKPDPKTEQKQEAKHILTADDDLFLQTAASALFANVPENERETHVLRQLLDHAIDTKNVKLLERMRQRGLRFPGLSPAMKAKLRANEDLLKYFAEEEDCPVCYESIKNKGLVADFTCDHIICRTCREGSEAQHKNAIAKQKQERIEGGVAEPLVELPYVCPVCRAPLLGAAPAD